MRRLWERLAQGEMKYLIFSFLRSDNEAKHKVEFHHSTCNAQEFGGKWDMECLNIKFPVYPAIYWIQCEAEKKNKICS